MKNRILFDSRIVFSVWRRLASIFVLLNRDLQFNRRRLTSSSFRRKFLFAVVCVCLGSLPIARNAVGQIVRKVETYTPPGSSRNNGSFEVAVVHSTGLVYNSGSAFGSGIGVVNPNTNALAAVITPAPANGFNGGAASRSQVNQSSNIIYFLLSNALVVVDGRPGSQTFNQTLPALSFANQTIIAFAVDQTRQRLYVSTRTVASNPVQSQIQIVDINPASAAFHQTSATVALPAGQAVGNLAINQTTNRVYAVTQATGGGVWILDGATNAVSQIAGTQPSTSIAVNETSNTIYAGRNGAAAVQAIDGANNTLTTSINLPSFIWSHDDSVAVNSTTGRIYFCLQNGSLSVIDGNRTSPTFNTAVANIPNISALKAALDESTNKIVVVSNDLRTTIIDGATNSVAAVTFANVGSTDVAVNPLTDRAFVAYQLHATQIINLVDNSYTNLATASEIGEGAVNPINNSFYFPLHRTTNEIAYFDASDNVNFVTGLPHGFGRILFTARNAQTNRVYMVNSSANLAGTATAPNFVSVIDGATNNIVANVEVGGQPFGSPAVNETTNKIYIPHVGRGASFPSKIMVIDGATNTAATVNTSAFPANTSFFRTIAANPVTNRIYFQVSDGTSVGVIDGATDVATPLAGFTGVRNILVNRNLNRVYFLTATGLRVLDGSNDQEITNIALSSASNIVINQTTGRIYVRSSVNQTLTVINGNTNTVVGTVLLAGQGGPMAINETTNRLYLGYYNNFSDESSSRISFINGETLAVEKTLPIPLIPGGIYVNPATKTVYATTVNASQRTGVVVIEATAYAIGGQVTTAAGGSALGGVTVRLSGSNSATTTTDSAGNYSFSNLPANGNYTVSVYKNGFNFDPASQSFDTLQANRTAGFSGTQLCTPPPPGGTGGGGDCQNASATPTSTNGNPVVVTTASSVNLTFSNVTGAGTTVATPIAPASAGALPAGYSFVAGDTAFDVRTSATFSGSIDVCFTISSVNDAAVFSRLVVFHNENGALVDRTISRDFAARRICARTASLSPFVVALSSAEPTAAAVSVGGRVTTATGRAIRGARVTIINQSGSTRTALTGQSGYYRFADVPAGETYIISVQAKRFSFSQPTQVLAIGEDAMEINFVAGEN